MCISINYEKHHQTNLYILLNPQCSVANQPQFVWNSNLPSVHSFDNSFTVYVFCRNLFQSLLTPRPRLKEIAKFWWRYTTNDCKSSGFIFLNPFHSNFAKPFAKVRHSLFFPPQHCQGFQFLLPRNKLSVSVKCDVLHEGG